MIHIPDALLSASTQKQKQRERKRKKNYLNTQSFMSIFLCLTLYTVVTLAYDIRNIPKCVLVASLTRKRKAKNQNGERERARAKKITKSNTRNEN
jgi:hypothetical protein